MIDLIVYIFSVLFGRNLRPTPLPHPTEVLEEAARAEETEPQDLDPVAPVPPAAPQILIPDPANQDLHGPASSLARAMLRKGYTIFEKDHEPWNLNIVAVRTDEPEFDRFRCRLVHFWKHQGEWQMDSWPITTLPGHRYMVERLLNPLGCAILAPGQYRGVYKLDRHRGIYEALCQRNGPVRVFRDGNRDRVYDMDPRTIQSGEFGINCHATENPDDGISRDLVERIGAASAGCLVNARVTDFVTARSQWRGARSVWGPDTTLTLLEDADLDDFGTIPHEAVVPQVSDKEAWMPPPPFTLGIRNRNLLNVKQGPVPWEFSTGRDAKNHAIFPNFPSGIRAGIRTLRTYWVKHKRRTLLQITERWAPSSDTVGSIAGNKANAPAEYAAFLSRRTGIPASSMLKTFFDNGQVRDPDELYRVVAAMVEFENHTQVKLPREVFDAGLALL